jgi:NOL1/NOP2/fmu family ribosome biogenesis protein
MFIHYGLSTILAEQRNLKALDLCAAPGGKTTLLASLPHFRLVLANEIIQSRVPALYENVVKWGASHVFVSNNDPEDFNKLEGFFDVALIDAPCSGSGLFRKDSDAARMWNTDLVDFCSSRQKRILTDGTKALAENGVLVYSTCSYSIEENERNLDFLMRDGEYESIQISIDRSWGVIETESPVHNAFGYRFYPDKLSGEGFFCAFLRKRRGGYFTHPEVTQKKGVDTHFDFLNRWINPAKELTYSTYDKDIFVVDAINKEDVQLLQRILTIRKSGIRIGSLLRNDIIPDHELAMSTLYSSEIRRFELDKEQALKYLRKDDFTYDISELGWVLLTYKGITMGWIKALSGRVNNYYPMKWRILMRK